MLPFLLQVAWGSHAASDRATLERVLTLAGFDRASLPIALATAAPASASSGVEAWTSYDADGNGKHIFLYTRSDMFLCASPPLSMRQCLLRLASAVVHEAWHLEHRLEEREAYETQIAFLMRNGAATEHVKAVRLAQMRVRAAERRATVAALERFRLAEIDRWLYFRSPEKYCVGPSAANVDIV
jgi:hypothetical protein